MKPPPAATMLRNELMSTIRRYAEESDVSVCEALGVLSMVESELLALVREGTPDEEGGHYNS